MMRRYFSWLPRSILRRSLSDGNIISDSSSPITPSDIMGEGISAHPFPATAEGSNKGLSESQPDISTCESDIPTPCEINISYSSYTPSMSARQLLTDMHDRQCFVGDCGCFGEHGDEFDSSDMLDLDEISSSGNSLEEETYDRSSLVGSPTAAHVHASGDIAAEGRVHGGRKSAEFSDSFLRWVESGSALFIESDTRSKAFV